MSEWPATKARQVLSALARKGWSVKRELRGSHRILCRPGWVDYTFAFREHEELVPRMLARIAKHTGLELSDLK